MHQEQEPRIQPGETSQESFLGSFGRVPNGLDPTQVYGYFLKTSARLRQLEEQARQTSAPFILESALREAAELRAQHAQSAERAYHEIVRAAQQEADRICAEARQRAQAEVDQARASLAAIEQEAEQIREQAREEATRLRRQALERNEQDEQELERLGVDLANLLQRLLDRRKAAGEEVDNVGSPAAGAVDAATIMAGATLEPAAAAAVPAGTEQAPTPAGEPELLRDREGAPRREEQQQPGVGSSGFRLPDWLDV